MCNCVFHHRCSRYIRIRTRALIFGTALSLSTILPGIVDSILPYCCVLALPVKTVGSLTHSVPFKLQPNEGWEILDSTEAPCRHRWVWPKQASVLLSTEPEAHGSPHQQGHSSSRARGQCILACRGSPRNIDRPEPEA